MLPWKLRKRHILPVNQNLSSVYFSLAKFQLVNCNLSFVMIWQMTYTQKLPNYIQPLKAVDVLEVTDVRKVAPSLDRVWIAFVARKAKIKQWMVFGITWLTEVLSVFTFAMWNVFTHSISNSRKIFVAEGEWYGFALFSYEHFVF